MPSERSQLNQPRMNDAVLSNYGLRNDTPQDNAQNKYTNCSAISNEKLVIICNLHKVRRPSRMDNCEIIYCGIGIDNWVYFPLRIKSQLERNWIWTSWTVLEEIDSLRRLNVGVGKKYR